MDGAAAKRGEGITSALDAERRAQRWRDSVVLAGVEGSLRQPQAAGVAPRRARRCRMFAARANGIAAQRREDGARVCRSEESCGAWTGRALADTLNEQHLGADRLHGDR